MKKPSPNRPCHQIGCCAPTSKWFWYRNKCLSFCEVHMTKFYERNPKFRSKT